MERFSNDDKSGKINTMIPDGVFTITDKKGDVSLRFPVVKYVFESGKRTV